MRRVIRWEEAASLDLAVIGQYLSKNFGVRVASKWIAKIISSTNTLATFPNIGHIYQHNPSYRVLTVKRSNIYYRINEKEIVIVAVFDNRRDDKTIKDYLKEKNK